MSSDARGIATIKTHWILVISILLFVLLIAWRAAVIPMTHDEASTWLSYRHHNMWGCLSDYYCWQYANNHWLNTLLLQGSAALFGEHPFVLRMPNVVAGVLYFLGATLFAWRYIKTPLLQLAGFLLLCSHVYLLDFFSLARGYGLMVCGVLWSVYALLRYLEQYRITWLLLSVSALVLAILSNFTSLLAYVSVMLVWFGSMFWHKQKVLLFGHGWVWITASVLLSALLYYPIRTLRGSGEFDLGADGLGDTILDLIRNILYGAFHDVVWFPWAVFGMVLLALLVITLSVLFAAKGNTHREFICLITLLVLNLLAIVVLEVVTGTKTPVGRKSIYLIPFLFLPLVLGLNLIRRKAMQLVTTITLCGVLTYQTIHAISFTSFQEWYYDSYYPELFDAIWTDETRADSIRLGSSWIFYPSLTYYQQAKPLPLARMEYQKKVRLDSTMQYYFVEHADTLGMGAAGFVLEKNIGPFFLFKNSFVLSLPPSVLKPDETGRH